MRVSGRLEGLRTTNNSNNDNIIFQQKDKHFEIYEKKITKQDNRRVSIYNNSFKAKMIIV